MAYTEPSLNDAHFTRPAVVLFKKSLATNEEMTAELEKLLGDSFPMVNHTLTVYSGDSSLKAIFYNVRVKEMTKISYSENAAFHLLNYKQTKENIITRMPTAGDIASSKIPVIDTSFKRKVSKFIASASSLVAYGPLGYAAGLFLKTRTSTKLRTTGKFLTGDFLKESVDKYYDSVESNDTQKQGNSDVLARTWYVFSLDDDYAVPEIKYGVYEGLGTNVIEEHTTDGVRIDKTFEARSYGIPTLDTHIIQNTTPLSIENFKKTTAYKLNAQKLEAEVFNKYEVRGVYQVVLQPSVNYSDITVVGYKEALGLYSKYEKNSNAKKFLKFSSAIDTFYKDMQNKYSFRQAYLNNKPQYNPTIKEKFKNEVTPFLSTDKYKIPVTKIFPELKGDLLLQISPNIANGVEYKLSLFAGASNSLYNLSYYVEPGDGNSGKIGYIVFTESDTFRDAVDAYYFLTQRINRDKYGNDTVTEEVLLRKFVNAEFPLRYRYQQLLTGGLIAFDALFLQDSNYNKSYINYGDADINEQRRQIADGTVQRITSEHSVNGARVPEKYTPEKFKKSNPIQFLAFLQSYNRGRVGKGRRGRVITRQSREAGGYNVRMIDFKLMYYMMIKYNVVLEKYKKLEEEFIYGNNSYSTVRMFPVNFFTATGELEGTTARVTKVDKKELYQIDFDTLAALPIETKKKLVSMYENVYYGGWSGFYYTNGTVNPEDIAPYSNTKLSDRILTTVQEYLNTDDESKYLEKYEGLTDFTRFRYLTELNDVKNSDVSDIVVSRQTMGKSQATITLKNIDNKYVFQKGIFKGESIFEPMDEVSIYFPTTRGGLTLAFTGYIDSTDIAVTNGYNMIGLQCSCPIKKLEINRTNVKPSMSGGLETDYTPLNPFLVPPKMMESVEHWIPFMLIQPLTYMTSMLGDIVHPESTMVYESKLLSNQGNYSIYHPEFNDPLLQYLWSRRSQHQLDVDKANEALTSLLHKYVQTIEYTNGEPVSACKPVNGITDIHKIYSFNNKSNKKDYKKVDYTIFAQRSDSEVALSGVRKKVAQMTGTLQPAFALGASEIPLVFSNYKSNLDILLETAEKFNFFLYSNRMGVVRFSPPIVSLTNLNMRDGLLDMVSMLKTKDYDYYTESPDILNKQNTISFRESCDDSKLVSWIQLTGGLVASASLDASKAGIATAVANWPLIKKYGYHSQKQQTVIGINSMPALRAYGMSLMDRANKNFRTASCDEMGSGDIDINTTVYSAINNTIYLRVGLTSHYQAGNTFTTSSTLNWGRKPLCPFTSDINITSSITEYANGGKLFPPKDMSIKPLVRETTVTTFSLNTFNEQLEQLLENNLISNAYYRQIKGILTSYELNKEYSQLFYSFIFNGYFWEGVPSISFEDLSTEFYSENIANGLELPLSVMGNNSIDSTVKQVTKTLTNNKKLEKNNTSTVFLSLFDQSSVSKMQDVYTSQ